MDETRQPQADKYTQTPGKWSKIVFLDGFLARHHHSRGSITDAWTTVKYHRKMKHPKGLVA